MRNVEWTINYHPLIFFQYKTIILIIRKIKKVQSYYNLIDSFFHKIMTQMGIY